MFRYTGEFADQLIQSCRTVVRYTSLQPIAGSCTGIYMAEQSSGDCVKYTEAICHKMVVAHAYTNLCLGCPLQGIWACNAVIADAYTLVYQHDVDSVCLKSKELYRTSVQAKQS